MTTPHREREVQAALETFGDALDHDKWAEGKPDIVAALHLTADDVPQLVAVARQWIMTDDDDDMLDDDDVADFAPIHAWRALAQMRAVEAVDLMLNLLHATEDDEEGGDWCISDFPVAFALIGPASLPALKSFLADSVRGQFSRSCAADSMQRIALRHPETREQVVNMLIAQLEQFSDQPNIVTTSLVDALLELKAKEAGELIERAYAADCVDTELVGTWREVRQELGVKGTGLIPEAPPAPGRRPQFGGAPKDLAQAEIQRGRDQRKQQRQNQNQNKKGKR